ncbi:MAG: hypothetical protein IPL26_25145 [Leptospiraceae bacterium]|nr:hypothetical protein [Leptospiraceae bacterium]
MIIYVNEEVLETKLEDEKTIGEIYQAINSWIESSGKYLVSCLVDGIEKNPSELKEILVDKVNRLDFYVGEDIDILIASLLELDKYIDNVGNTLFGRDSLTQNESNDLKEGLTWIQTVLGSAQTLLRLDYTRIIPFGSEFNMLEIIAKAVDPDNKLDSVQSIEAYLENLRDLKLFVMDLLNRVTLLNIDSETVKEILTTYGENMEVLKKEFIRVNENFQSGKDHLATELLSHSTGRLHVMISGLISVGGRGEFKVEDIKIGEDTLYTVNTLLNEKLSQVEQALSDKDIVTAGDILEYELPEILEKFVPFLNEIKAKLN